MTSFSSETWTKVWNSKRRVLKTRMKKRERKIRDVIQRNFKGDQLMYKVCQSHNIVFPTHVYFSREMCKRDALWRSAPTVICQGLSNIPRTTVSPCIFSLYSIYNCQMNKEGTKSTFSFCLYHMGIDWGKDQQKNIEPTSWHMLKGHQDNRIDEYSSDSI